MNPERVLLMAALSSALSPCMAAPVPQKVLDAYAGEYSAGCGDPKALRARISEKGLSLVRGTTTVTGAFEIEALSYMGPNPPQGYETSLMSNAKGLGSIVFIIYRSKSGPLIDLEADPPVLKRVGIAKRGTVKYRKC